jgi:hypothetical protein
MKLDGLTLNPIALGEAAMAAIEFIASHIHSHSFALKVQTSRGNYLSSLSVCRAEKIFFPVGLRSHRPPFPSHRLCPPPGSSSYVNLSLERRPLV